MLPTFTQRMYAMLAGFHSGNTTTVLPEAESVAQVQPDPRDAEVTLTVGVLDDLNTRLRFLEHLTARKNDSIKHSLRRAILTAKLIGGLLKATNVSAVALHGNDGVSVKLSNDIGEWLEVTVYPFRDEPGFEIRDANGVMRDKYFPFGDETDLTPDTILMVTGFGELASRRSADQSEGYWAELINDELALTSEIPNSDLIVTTG